MKQFGLIGYSLAHSFSEKYFQTKFRKEKVSGYDYRLFPLETIEQFPELINENPNLVGLNVTVPHKETVIKYLDVLDETAKAVGAVNCIKIVKQQERIKLLGYNTDVYGFEEALKPILKSSCQKALILGSGGSAKAVAYVLNKLGIASTNASRNPSKRNEISYNDLNKSIIREHLLIINTTPLGMYPETKDYPPIPYEYLSDQHVLFDLIYNPEQTIFLQKGVEQGASIKNGLEMLHLQAEKSFEIWEQ